jgi:hypothetical protein
MNYFAHGRHYVDDPYVLAGTAVPDWLNVVDRRIRVRSKHALPHVNSTEAHLARIARGIVEHHRDDAWFHETRAFHELCWQLTRLVRDCLPPDEGFRPSFLGHILIEILLDAELIAAAPAELDAYYQALQQIDGARVQQAINLMSPRPTENLASVVPFFCRERFLFDYADDGKLWFRLNQVMRRVGLPLLPPSLTDILPHARQLVRERQDDLLQKSPAGATVDSQGRKPLEEQNP